MALAGICSIVGRRAPEPEVATKPPECPPGGNLSLSPKLRHRDVSYSGQVFHSRAGWVGTHHDERWAELGGPQERRVLRVWAAAADPAPPLEFPVKGAAVAATESEEDDEFGFCLSSVTGGFSEFFHCSSDEDRAQWVARVSVSILQAGIDLPLPDAQDTCAKWAKIVAAGPAKSFKRLKPLEFPEQQADVTLRGYVTCRYTSGSLMGAVFGVGGANWKRRWLTVHDSFATIREDKKIASGYKVMALRDVEASWANVSGSPWSFQISGAFLPELTLSFGDEDAYTKWYSAALAAIRNNTPDAETEDISAFVAKEVAEIKQEVNAGRLG